MAGASLVHDGLPLSLPTVQRRGWEIVRIKPCSQNRLEVVFRPQPNLAERIRKDLRRCGEPHLRKNLRNVPKQSFCRVVATLIVTEDHEGSEWEVLKFL